MRRSFFSALRWARLRWRTRQRQEYYDYLADILDATQGRKTLKQVLAHDALRYGSRTVRGRLSEHWAYQIEEHGDLALAFSATLPAREVAMIGMMQRMGGGALAGGFRDLAALLRLDMRIRDILIGTLSMGGFALLVCVATMFAIAWFTTPTLLSSFTQVDPLLYGAATKRLVGFTAWLDTWLWLLLAFMAGTLFGLKWLLPRWRGKARRMADRRLPGFSLYRDTQAIGFLVSLAAILKPRSGLNHSLTDALAMMHEYSTPWLQAHIADMALRLSDARAGASVFKTGLLDTQTYWYLEDLAQAIGMDAALQKTRQRLEHGTLSAVAKRANVLRWTMIGAALAFLLGAMLWHYAVIHEMRAALLLAY